MAMVFRRIQPFQNNEKKKDYEKRGAKRIGHKKTSQMKPIKLWKDRIICTTNIGLL